MQQSYDAKERSNDSSLPFHLSYGNLNGDGFGIGWYPLERGKSGDGTPCTFTSVTPAWNNDNLNRLATKLESGLIFAHVRAAYPGMPVSEQNCHPFAHGHYMFMHNGVIAGFMSIRRKLLEELKDEAYNAVQSFHSDSAVSFALFLNHLPNLHDKQSPEVLLAAIQATIATISRIQAECGITGTSLLNYVVSDGNTMVATRFVSNEHDQPASLYYAEGHSFERMQPLETTMQRKAAAADAAAVGAAGVADGSAGVRSKSYTEEGDYHLTYDGTASRVFLVASEPVTSAASDWAEVPRNTALVVCREKGPLLAVIHAPLCSQGIPARQEEVNRSLEAVAGVVTMNTGHNSFGGPLDDLMLASAQKTPRLPSGLKLTIPRQNSNQSLPHLDTGIPPIVNREDHRLTGHKGAVVSLCVEGDLLFSGSTDSTIKVWSVRECKLKYTLKGHRDPIRQLLVHNGTLYSAGAKTVRMWKLPDFTCTGVLIVGDLGGSLKALALGPNGTVFVGGQDCKVKAYNDNDSIFAGDGKYCSEGGIAMADSPRCATTTETIRAAIDSAHAPSLTTPPSSDHCSSVTALAVCGDTYLCSASSDSTIRVWKLDTLELVKVLRGHRGSVLTLHAAPGLFLSGGRDNLIRVWDIDTLVCRRTLSGHTDDVLSISSLIGYYWDSHEFETPQGGFALRREASMTDLQASEPGSPTMAAKRPVFFLSASADGSLRLWSARCYSCLHVFSTSSGPFHMSFLSCVVTETTALSGLSDGSIALHSIEGVHTGGDDHNNSNGPAGKTGSGLSEHDHPRSVSKRMKLDNGSSAAPSAAAVNGDCQALVNGQSSTLMKQTAASRLEKEFDKALRNFIRIKTVSADPNLSEECFRGAKFLTRMLESMGAEVKLSQPVEGCNPVVLGRVGSDSSRPTITCYGHYDVQPAMEPEWTTDPFEITAIDGYLYARGVSDNKGPILAFMYAVRELLEAATEGDGLPVNVVFLFEGEEENGSKGFFEAVQQNLRWFEGTKAILISNTLWVGEERPCLTYGMRGMISLSIEVKGPSKDLHSGNDGGVISEPLTDLCRVLGTLCDSHHVQVPGFYDHVRFDTLQAALERLEGCKEFSLESYCKSLGVEKLTTGKSERELLEARWSTPTLSVVDIRVGTAEDADTAHYRFGPTRFSVIPKAAVGKLSIRSVPDQDATKLVEKLTQHVQHEFAKLRSGNVISVKVHNIGQWWEADLSSPLMQMAEDAIKMEWGVQPLLVKEGGTMPVASALERMLNAPALLLPLGQSSDACHLANERIRKINLVRGKGVIKNLLQAMGEAKT